MLKRLIKAISVSLAFLMLFSSVVLAAWEFSFPTTVIDTSGTARVFYPALLGYGGQSLIDDGKILATGLDTNMQIGTQDIDHMMSTTQVASVIPNLPAGGQATSTLYTGYTTAPLTTQFPVIVGEGGHATIDDAPALEPGNDFEFELEDAYVDTSDSNFKHLMQKRAATGISVTDTNEISGIVYFDEPVDVSPAGFGAWTDIDITAYVPAYATGAVVHLYTSNVFEEIGVRINGSAQQLRGDIYGHLWTMVGIDAGDIFEGWIEAATCHIYLVGFTGSGVTYKVVADDISLAGVGAWTDIDLAAEAPSAIGVIVGVKNNNAGAEIGYGLRKNNSGDNRITEIQRSGWYYGIVGCDASQIIDGYVVAVTVDFYLTGYITADFTFNTNAVDKSLAGGFAAWTDIDCSANVPADTNYIIFEVSTASTDYGFRRNGSTENIHPELRHHCWTVVECDSDRIVEMWAEDATVDCFLIGYTQGYIDDPYDVRVTAVGVTPDEYTVTTSLNSNAFTAADYGAYTTIGVSMGQGILPVVLLDEQELVAPAASVTFADIDTLVTNWNTYAGVTSRHLVFIVNATSTNATTSTSSYIQCNGVTANVYNSQRLRGVGGAASAAALTAGYYEPFYIPGATLANAFGGGCVLIPYAFNTTNHKTILSTGGGCEDSSGISVSRWANTSAITSVRFYDGASLATGSTFWLGVVDERYLVEEDLLAAPGTIDFAAIPQDGSDLVIIGYSRGTVAAVEDELVLELNTDGVAANYNTQRLLGTAAVASAATVNNNLVGYTSGANATANAFGAFVGFINQYAEVANDPHYLTLNGYHESTGVTSRVGVYSGRRNNVAAITSVEFYGSGAANLAAGTLFSLYRVPRYVIDRQELVAPTATITFATIPQGYEALQLNIYTQSTDVGATDTVLVSYNNDVVAANYDTQSLDGTGAVVTAARSAADRILMQVPAAGAGADIWGGGIANIPNYAKANRHKHYTNISGSAEASVYVWSSRWESLNPITEIDLTLTSTDNFDAGTIVELVGIFPQDVFAIEVDGDLYDIDDGNNLTVPDTDTTDWVLFGKETVLSYFTSYNHTVGPTLIVHYEPNTMVVGTAYNGTADAGGSATTIVDAELTQANDYWNLAKLTITDTTDDAAPKGEVSVITDFEAASDTLYFGTLTVGIDAGDTYTVDFGTLVDLEAPVQNARITWGNNTNLTIVYGEMDSSESTSATGAAAGGFTMPTSPLPTTWFATGGGLAALPLYDVFSEVSALSGMPVQTMYFWAIIGFAFGVALLLIVYTRSALLGVVAMLIVLFVGSSMTIIPMWIPFVILIVDVGIMYIYKQVSY